MKLIDIKPRLEKIVRNWNGTPKQVSELKKLIDSWASITDKMRKVYNRLNIGGNYILGDIYRLLSPFYLVYEVLDQPDNPENKKRLERVLSEFNKGLHYLAKYRKINENIRRQYRNAETYGSGEAQTIASNLVERLGSVSEAIRKLRWYIESARDFLAKYEDLTDDELTEMLSEHYVELRKEEQQKILLLQESLRELQKMR